MSWWQQSIFYHIYPLGFFGCPALNPIATINPTLAQIQPVPRLAKIRQYYSHFKKLNIQAIYFGPLFESCTHGYDTIDFCQIDRRLGTNQLFQEIVAELHQLNIKVIIDGVFNHTSRLFLPFIDLKRNQSKSPYLSWFKKVNFNSDTIWRDGFSYKYYQDCVELPELNLKNTDVQKYIFKTIQFWFQQYQIDGLRLDVAYQLKPEFLRKINLLTTDLNPQSVLIGELISPADLKMVNDNSLQTGTNYYFFQHLHQSFSQQDFWQLKLCFEQQKDQYLFNFLNNHDTSRIATLIDDYPNLQSAFVILFTYPGQICLYYGDELLFDGQKKSKHDYQVRSQMINLKNISAQQTKHFNFIQKLIKIRQKNSFINTGQLQVIHCHYQSIGYIITKNNDSILIIINSNPQKTLSLFHPLLANHDFVDLFNQSRYHAKNSSLKLPSQNFFILQKSQ